MSRTVYVVEGDNNEEYEDNLTWVEGVFGNLAAAHEYLADRYGARKYDGDALCGYWDLDTETWVREPLDRWDSPEPDEYTPPTSWYVREWEVQG